jgi:class III poly(R)-hydroxyalkanoic acid synthase PhaC subunit
VLKNYLDNNAKFLRLTVGNEKPQPYWSTRNKVILNKQTLNLHHFPHKKIKQKHPVLILPPQAGNHCNLADFAPDQSLVRVFQQHGFDVYVTEWLSATYNDKDLGIEDYINLTDDAIEAIKENSAAGKVHIVGQCQGGWQAAMYSSLFPQKIKSLIVAAAPIDFEAEKCAITSYVKMPLSYFRALVSLGFGLMDGKIMVLGFKSLQMNEHYHLKYKHLWEMIENNDEDAIQRYLRFENWYGYTQKLPGRFYLEVVDKLFKKNELVKKLIKINGEFVDLQNIHCRTIILAGEKDHITRPKQVLALRDHVSTPKKKIFSFLSSGGHIGTLMSKDSLRDNWPKVAELLKVA